MKTVLIGVFCSITALQPYAQQSMCANDRLLQQIFAKNPRAQAIKTRQQADWVHFNEALALSKMVVMGKDTAYEVPVVVHVVHTGGGIGTAFNPTDAAITALVDYINKTWAATWPAYRDTFSGGTRLPVRFVLAKRSPACAPTTGINRVDGSALSGYTTNGVCPFGIEAGPSDAEVKQLSMWPARDYYNIWLVNEIENGLAGGYAPWPWYGEDLLDGAVILSQYAIPLPGGDYYEAAPHELGHSFGLYHTFQGGCDVGPCLTSGDELCDTEPHDLITRTCDAGNMNSCTGAIFNGVEHNIMNYTTCPDHFTKDQRKRALFTLNRYRMGLVNSLGATVPDPAFIVPKTACVPVIVNSLNTENAGPCKISFSNMITSSSGYNDDGNVAYLDRTCIQQAAMVTKGMSYKLSVSTSGVPQTVKAFIDYNNDGNFQDTELVYTHIGTLSEETHTGTVNIPVAGVAGNTNLRMRIMADYIDVPAACKPLLNGQAEDYTVFVSIPAGIGGVALSPLFRIYPNPATNKISIDAPEAAQLRLFSMEGKLLHARAFAAELDIAGLVPGLYFIQAYTADGTFIGAQKLVKTP
jgi:hypothetical protein